MVQCQVFLSVLFDCSIRENICYAKADASEAEIVAACKEANAYDFIQKLPMQVLLVVMMVVVMIDMVVSQLVLVNMMVGNGQSDHGSDHDGGHNGHGA